MQSRQKNKGEETKGERTEFREKSARRDNTLREACRYKSGSVDILVWAEPHGKGKFSLEPNQESVVVSKVQDARRKAQAHITQ